MLICAIVAASCMALAPAVASAKLPEWGKCVEQEGGGKYLDAGCTSKAATKKTGTFEWVPIEKEGEFFLEPMTMTGSFAIETADGKRIECSTLAHRSFMKINGKHSAHTPLWELKGCASEGQECHSQLAASKEEINNLAQWLEEPPEEGAPAQGWKMKLGIVSGGGGPEPVAGWEYTPKNHERMFEPVVCLGPIGTVWVGSSHQGGNSLITTIQPVNQMTTEFTETFAESAPGIQTPASFEGKKPVHLEAFIEGHWEPVAILATYHYITEHEESSLELKATP